ncbi:MAG: DUF721 domain-containing protein [Humidesulfovibrio sp.]|nr:DUF721 domain-containing protein [Humidesulfovibrio sp.]
MRARRRMQHPGRESRHRRVGGDWVMRVLSRYDRKGGLKLVRLWLEWETVVGPEVAELARPLGHKDGTLLLYTEDAIAAQQLTYFTPEILLRVNDFLEQEVFDKVRFELLNGRVPLGENRRERPMSSSLRVQRPPILGGLAGKLDPESAVGRCYMAYVKRFTQDGEPVAEPVADTKGADRNANTRPTGASRRRK